MPAHVELVTWRKTRLWHWIAVMMCLIAGCERHDRIEQAANERDQTQRNQRNEATRSLERGVHWLLAQQSDDGGWHSQTYGQMQGGAGNTALIVYALAHLSESGRYRIRPQLERAVRFLFVTDGESATPRLASADYPTYATALLILTIDRLQLDIGREQEDGLIKALKRTQRTRETILPGQEDCVGGWSPSADVSAGANISATNLALQALRSRNALDENICASALHFLAKCQNLESGLDLDGGFCFVPIVEDPLNKAGSAPRGDVLRGNSYGSPTTDGLAALLAIGLPSNHPRVEAATHWLQQHDSAPLVPGFDGDDVRSTASALTFYYLSALARCIAVAPDSRLSRQATPILSTLVAQQQSDGSWRNSNTLMREDDPLVATAFALHALAILSQDPSFEIKK